MTLITTDRQKGARSRGRRKGGARHWSIARRLAVSNIVLILLSYSLFAVYFYHVRAADLWGESAKGLVEEAVSVRNILQQPNARQLLSLEMRAQLYEPDNLRPYIRILDPAMRTVMESPGMHRVLPVPAFPPRRQKSEAVQWRNGSGEAFLVKAIALGNDVAMAPGGTLQIAVNVDDYVHLLSRLRVALSAALSLAVAFALGCTLIIVRLAMRPLSSMSQAVSLIDGHHIHLRVDESRLPRELLSLAKSFNGMLERLATSFDQLSHYAGNLAHELRTPINNLMMQGEITLSRARTPEEYQKVLASSQEEYGRLSRTIDRLLFLARADTKQSGAQRRELELGAEVEEVVDYFADAAADAGVAMRMEGGATLCADPTLFRTALGNLLSNALNHTAAGGEIAVTIRQGKDGSVEVTVQDTGSGIEPRHLPRVFDRFYRVRGADGGAEGAGLGLSVVKAVMQMHDGDATIESAPGKGTRVSLHFPAPLSPCGDEGKLLTESHPS